MNITIRVLALASFALIIAGCDDGAANEPVAVRPAVTAVSTAVSALGRLEPEHGIIRIAAPSIPGVTAGVVVRDLLVDEGDTVEAGQLLAVTDLFDILEAAVTQAQASLALTHLQAESAVSRADSTCVLADVHEQEAARRADWETSIVASREEAERARGIAVSSRAACAAERTAAVAVAATVAVAEAMLARARADARQAHVFAPTDGRVLRIHSRPGTAVSSRGLLELGRVDRMFALAEVYETDIHQVRVGQRATVTSPALPATLGGAVYRIRQKVEKQDEIGTDPAARKDARIVEVEIALDDPAAAAALTNLQVIVIMGQGN